MIYIGIVNYENGIKRCAIYTFSSLTIIKYIVQIIESLKLKTQINERNNKHKKILVSN